jgi:hypothetical protein
MDAKGDPVPLPEGYDIVGTVEVAEEAINQLSTNADATGEGVETTGRVGGAFTPDEDFEVKS